MKYTSLCSRKTGMLTNDWTCFDNFRLYYVGQNKGDNIHGISNGNPDRKDEVDVFDLTGRMVRQSVKRADALRGIRKGIYIVDGKKYIVK